ncbi:MAG: hypothetical protein M3460_02880 [Actinomycetota bacterium]|nr:hypothetical protein [Actinomycetota bacterium]
MIDATDKTPDHHQPPTSRSTRRAIPITCTKHGTPGFTNLVVRTHGDQIELDPHVDGSCVLRLKENSARVLFEALAEWLS